MFGFAWRRYTVDTFDQRQSMYNVPRAILWVNLIANLSENRRLSMKQRPLLVGLAVSFVSCIACFAFAWASEPDGEQTSKLDRAQTELVNRVFASRLLEIAAEYKQYERVDQTIRWSPTLCRVPPKPPQNLASLSKSDSEETHGKKLYYLYARKPWEYKSNVWGIARTSGEAEVRAPLGQVLVKEAWEPVKVEPLEKTSSNPAEVKPAAKPKAYAMDGKDTYHAGDKKGLFIMFKTSEDTPGTDQGWVYGTVSADGTKVTSVGLVKNCMQCHQDAAYDRQIGLGLAKGSKR